MKIYLIRCIRTQEPTDAALSMSVAEQAAGPALGQSVEIIETDRDVDDRWYRIACQTELEWSKGWIE